MKEIKYNYAFTLIEILIVISIIAALITVPFFAFSALTATSRDNQRQADLNTIQTSLESYKERNGVYPEDLDTLIDEGFLAELPEDPLQGQPVPGSNGSVSYGYRENYNSTNGGQSYRILLPVEDPVTDDQGNKSNYVTIDPRGSDIVQVTPGQAPPTDTPVPTNAGFPTNTPLPTQAPSPILAGTFTTQWGTKGTEEGQIRADTYGTPGWNSISMDVSDSGDVFLAEAVSYPSQDTYPYVADVNQVLQFSSDGTFLRQWGTILHTVGNDGTDDLYEVTLLEDGSTHGPCTFGSDAYGSCGIDREMHLTALHNLHVMGDRLYVNEPSNDWLFEYSFDGQRIRTFSIETVFYLVNVELVRSHDDGGFITSTDSSNHVNTNDLNGNLVNNHINASFSDTPEVDGLTDLANDPLSSGYFASPTNGAFVGIGHFAEDGTLLNTIPGHDSGSGPEVPVSFDIDSDGTIYALYNQANLVHVYQPDGTLITQLGEVGSGDGQFSDPQIIRVDAQYVYILDLGHYRIMRYTK